MECRFRDCAHKTEPGCAVRGAIEDGTVSTDRWEAYLHFVDEQAAAADRAAERDREAEARREAAAAQRAREAAADDLTP